MKKEHAAKETTLPLKRRILLGIGLPLWVAVGFVLASMLAGVVISLLFQIGLLNIGGDSPAFLTAAAALVYVLTLLLVVGIPYKLKQIPANKKELGLSRLPTWTDIALAPAGFIMYTLMAGVLLAVISGMIPGFDADEVQDVGFENLGRYYEYVLASITLVVVAPLAEEMLVRGYLHGKLRKFLSAASTIAITSLLFAALHLGFGESAEGGFAITQWNVALNILPLGIILAVLREMTGSIWASVLLHMLKNGVAFYLLFINPSILTTIGG